MSKPKGRRRQVPKNKETARKVSELLTAIARLTRAVSVLVDTTRQVVRMSRLPRGALRYPPDGSPTLCQPARASVHGPAAVVIALMGGCRPPYRQPEKRIKAGEPWFQVRHGLPVNHK